jgi:hypothetical protein
LPPPIALKFESVAIDFLSDALRVPRVKTDQYTEAACKLKRDRNELDLDRNEQAIVQPAREVAVRCGS